MLEVEKEILSIRTIINIPDDNNNKGGTHELKGSSDRKDKQAENCKIPISSKEAFARISFKDGKKNERERRKEERNIIS